MPSLRRTSSLALPRFFTVLLIALLAAAFGWCETLADTVTIPAAKDNTLFGNPEGAVSSGSGPGLFAGNNGSGNTRRAVIAFDVASHVPAGAIIDSVALVLNVSSAPNDTPQPISLHRLLADWGEGASSSSGGAGAMAAAGDATWLHRFYPDQYWVRPGGQFIGATSATAVVGTAGAHAWSTAQMATDVQKWLDGATPDHGWLLMGDESANSTVRRFDSRENSDPAARPYLFVSYALDPTPTRVTTWGQLKRRYITPSLIGTRAAMGGPER